MDQQWLDILESAGIILAIIAGTIVIALVFNWFFRRFIRRSSLVMRTDPTNYQFLRHAITAVIYAVGFGWALSTLPQMKSITNSILATAGILAAAVGFASQHALSNIISGMFIVLFKPFRVNDRLYLRDDRFKGVVEDITLRHTVIRDFQNRRILIPNSVISDEVILNADFEDDKVISWVEVNISFDADIDLARRLMQEEAEANPLTLDGRNPEQIAAGDPVVRVRVVDLLEYAVRLRAWVWTRDNADAFVVRCDLLEAIKKRFTREGVEIPTPYRTLVDKKELPPNAQLESAAQ